MKFVRGMTVIEMIVVIVVLSVLVVIGLFAWTAWNNAMNRSEIETELNTVIISMDQHLNFNDKYPTSIPSSYRPGRSVTLTYISGNDTSYCINATTSKDPELKYKVANGVISEGEC